MFPPIPSLGWGSQTTVSYLNGLAYRSLTWYHERRRYYNDRSSQSYATYLNLTLMKTEGVVDQMANLLSLSLLLTLSQYRQSKKMQGKRIFWKTSTTVITRCSRLRSSCSLWSFLFISSKAKGFLKWISLSQQPLLLMQLSHIRHRSFDHLCFSLRQAIKKGYFRVTL